MERIDSTRRLAPLSRSDFALLHIGPTRLIVPLEDVRELEPTANMQREEEAAQSIGWIAFAGQRRPVYCLSPELAWESVLPEGRSVCALMEAHGQIFGVLCDEAALLDNDAIAFHDVPAAMALSGAPFHRLAVHGNGIACVSSAAELLADLQDAAQAGAA